MVRFINCFIMTKGGFDSIPSDLTSFLAVQRLKQISDHLEVGEVQSQFKLKGGASGGTLASAMAMMNGPKEDMKVAANPFALSPGNLTHSFHHTDGLTGSPA